MLLHQEDSPTLEDSKTQRGGTWSAPKADLALSRRLDRDLLGSLPTSTTP